MRNVARLGFSLIELVVVVSILVLLAGVLIPVVRNEMEKSMIGKAMIDMRQLSDAYNRYYVHTGYWPTEPKAESIAASSNFDLTSMPCLYTNSHSRKNWNGPYISMGTLVSGAWQVAAKDATGAWAGYVDPWLHPYRIYQFPRGTEMGPYGGIAIVSAGKDGTHQSTVADVASGNAMGDDVILAISRAL